MSQLHVYQGGLETRLLRHSERVPTVGTVNRQTDVVGALTRGLAEYLMQCELHNWCDGRAYAFRSAHDQAPDTHDDRADMPSVLVSVGAVDFTSGLSGGTVGAATLPAPGNEPTLDGVEVVAPMVVRVFAQTKSERSALLALVQDALTVNPGELNVRLLLPFYHSTFAIYSMVRLENFNEGAEKRIWSADVVVQASAQFIRVFSPAAAPPAQVFSQVEVTVGVAPFPIRRPLSPLHETLVVGGGGAVQPSAVLDG